MLLMDGANFFLVHSLRCSDSLCWECEGARLGPPSAFCLIAFVVLGPAFMNQRF